MKLYYLGQEILLSIKGKSYYGHIANQKGTIVVIFTQESYPERNFSDTFKGEIVLVGINDLEYYVELEET